MSTLEVLTVSVAAGAGEELSCRMDAPCAGNETDLFVLPVAGWVLSRVSPVISLEITHERQLIKTVPLRPNPKLAREHGVPEDTPCGFSNLVGVLGLPERFTLDLTAVLRDGTRVAAASITARHEPLRPPFQPKLQPIMVTGLERSGSTWLMTMLASHHKVVVDGAWPYETWTARYLAHTLKVLTDPANHVQSSMTHGFQNDPWHVGHNPYFTATALLEPRRAHWFGRTYAEGLAGLCQSGIDELYAALAETTGKAEPVYFAEKHLNSPSLCQTVLWELYGHGKEIFLVRDFRDVACSRIAVSRRGRPNKLGGLSEQDFVRQTMRPLAFELLAAWRERADQAHLVRYEDLVLRPAETIEDLLEYLELEASPQGIEELSRAGATAARSGHLTSPSQEASIGRWQHEPDESLRTILREAFDDVLAEFGYLDIG